MLMVIKLLEIDGVRISFILVKYSSAQLCFLGLSQLFTPSSAAPGSFLISVSALSSMQEPEAKPTPLC